MTIEKESQEYVKGIKEPFDGGTMLVTTDLELAFQAGAKKVIAVLRGKAAEKKCIENTLGTGNFVSHSEWADWLEQQLGFSTDLKK